jgi:hypothetical protein
MAHQKIQQQEVVQTHNNQMRRAVLQLFKISLLAQKMTKIRIPPQWTLDRIKAQTVHIQQYKMTTPPQVQLQKKEQNEYYVKELCP